jgi:hypothetical protein
MHRLNHLSRAESATDYPDTQSMHAKAKYCLHHSTVMAKVAQSQAQHRILTACCFPTVVRFRCTAVEWLGKAALYHIVQSCVLHQICSLAPRFLGGQRSTTHLGAACGCICICRLLPKFSRHLDGKLARHLDRMDGCLATRCSEIKI